MILKFLISGCHQQVGEEPWPNSSPVILNPGKKGPLGPAACGKEAIRSGQSRGQDPPSPFSLPLEPASSCPAGMPAWELEAAVGWLPGPTSRLHSPPSPSPAISATTLKSFPCVLGWDRSGVNLGWDCWGGGPLQS